jgi:hypothetical protein
MADTDYHIQRLWSFIGCMQWSHSSATSACVRRRATEQPSFTCCLRPNHSASHHGTYQKNVVQTHRSISVPPFDRGCVHRWVDLIYPVLCSRWLLPSLAHVDAPNMNGVPIAPRRLSMFEAPEATSCQRAVSLVERCCSLRWYLAARVITPMSTVGRCRTRSLSRTTTKAIWPQNRARRPLLSKATMTNRRISSLEVGPPCATPSNDVIDALSGR